LKYGIPMGTKRDDHPAPHAPMMSYSAVAMALAWLRFRREIESTSGVPQMPELAHDPRRIKSPT